MKDALGKADLESRQRAMEDRGLKPITSTMHESDILEGDSAGAVDDFSMISRYILLTDSNFSELRMDKFGRSEPLSVEEAGRYLGLGNRTTMTLKIKEWRESGELQRQRSEMISVYLEAFEQSIYTLMGLMPAIVLNLGMIAAFGGGKNAIEAGRLAFEIVDKVMSDKDAGVAEALDFIKARQQAQLQQK